VSIKPKNCNDSGNVTNDLSAVKVKHTNDEAVINKLVLLIINAWQNASRYTENGMVLKDIKSSKLLNVTGEEQ